MDNKEINQEVKTDSSNNSKINKILIICIVILIVAIVGIVLFFVLKKDKLNNASKNALSEEASSNKLEEMSNNKPQIQLDMYQENEKLIVNLHKDNNYELDKVEIEVDGKFYESYFNTQITNDMLLINLLEGEHKYTITAYDKLGNYVRENKTIDFNIVEMEAEKLLQAVRPVKGFETPSQLSSEEIIDCVWFYLIDSFDIDKYDSLYKHIDNKGYELSKNEIEQYVKDIFNIEYKNHIKTKNEHLKYENGYYYFEVYCPDAIGAKIINIKKLDNKTYNVDFRYYSVFDEDNEDLFTQGKAVIKLDGNNYYISSLSTNDINETTNTDNSKNNTTIENTIDNSNTTTSNPINNTTTSNVSNNTSNNTNTQKNDTATNTISKNTNDNSKTNTVTDNTTNSNTNNNTNTIAPVNPQKEDDLYLNVELKENQLRNPLDFYDLVIVEYELPSALKLRNDYTYSKTYRRQDDNTLDLPSIELNLNWKSIDEFNENMDKEYKRLKGSPSVYENLQKSDKKIKINGREYYYIEFKYNIGKYDWIDRYYYTKINDRYTYSVNYYNDYLTESELNKLLNIKVINSL